MPAHRCQRERKCHADSCFYLRLPAVVRCHECCHGTAFRRSSGAVAGLCALFAPPSSLSRSTPAPESHHPRCLVSGRGCVVAAAARCLRGCLLSASARDGLRRWGASGAGRCLRCRGGELPLAAAAALGTGGISSALPEALPAALPSRLRRRATGRSRRISLRRVTLRSLWLRGVVNRASVSKLAMFGISLLVSAATGDLPGRIGNQPDRPWAAGRKV